MPEPEVAIVIADDHPIFRDGLRRLLEAEPGFRVVGEASDGMAAVRMVRELRPDVLLLDLSMPRGPGLQALAEMGALTDEVHTVILTAGIEKPQVVEALRLGARGIVLKEAATEMLLRCIRAVMAGQVWLGREDVGALMRSRDAPQPARGEAPWQRLTPRELQVVAAIVEGGSNRDIARKLGISEDTVKHHLASIFDKVGVSNRLELALFAVSRKLVDEA